VPATWTPAFDFYFGTRNGVPFLESVDLAANDHIPLSSHPVRLRVRVRMHDPRDDGLRSPQETDALYEVDDRLRELLERECDAIYWGKTITDGWTYFSYQIPAGLEARDIGWPEDGIIAGYPTELSARSDPEWGGYRSAYPNTYQEHQMHNRAQQRELEEQGDCLAKRRRVNHLALFPSATSMEAAILLLKKAKFRIDDRFQTDVPDDAKRFGVEFHRTNRCDGRWPDAITAQILDCIEPSDGCYDGWGCFVKR
jgi:hypothetical protein